MKTETGLVTVPQHYFHRMALADYSAYRKALAREFFQNSIDARSSVIHAQFDEAEGTITVTDDGCGMDYDTIKNKLLELGGSGKPEGSVGAFGKAKEILYFAWHRYEIKTGNLVVTGTGSKYTIKSQEANVSGVVSKIWIDKDDLRDIRYSFKDVAQRIQTDCQIVVDGDTISCALRRGKLVAEDDGFKVYYEKRKNSTTFYANVRVSGIWMYQVFISDTPGDVVVELNNSLMLTSNRDGLTSPYSNKLGKFLTEVIKRQDEILNPKPKTFIEYIKGSGPIQTLKNMLKKVQGENVDEGPSQSLEDAIAKATDFFGDGLHTNTLINELVEMGTEPQIAALRMNAPKSDRWASRLALAGYEPDFILKYNSDSKRRAVAFLATKRASKLANAWSEILKQVMLDNDIFMSFRAGFIFQENTAAEKDKDDDGIYAFFLNPTLLLDNLAHSEPWTNNRLLMEDLKLKACHEVSHIRASYHDENFVGVLHKFISSTWLSTKCFEQIRKNCL